MQHLGFIWSKSSILIAKQEGNGYHCYSFLVWSGRGPKPTILRADTLSVGHWAGFRYSFFLLFFFFFRWRNWKCLWEGFWQRHHRRHHRRLSRKCWGHSYRLQGVPDCGFRSRGRCPDWSQLGGAEPGVAACLRVLPDLNLPFPWFLIFSLKGKEIVQTMNSDPGLAVGKS